MFSSLDRVDIVLDAGPDGRPWFVQTDHRTAAEMERERALSTLFALIRVLNPKRLAHSGEPEPLILYRVREPPPDFLRRAIHAAGGRLAIGEQRQPETWAGEPPPLSAIINSAFAELADVVAAEYGVSLNRNGLEAVENRLAESAGVSREHEYAYWSAVLKLGGFGGELIRASNGGQWTVTESGSLPLALMTRYRGQEVLVNPLGKAIKRFANGQEDSLIPLVNLVCSQP